MFIDFLFFLFSLCSFLLTVCNAFLQEVIRSQFVGIRVTRRELAPGMAKKLAQVDVHTIEILGILVLCLPMSCVVSTAESMYSLVSPRIIQCKLKEESGHVLHAL